ncbi:MAG: tetratricopeptide repeat protein [Treponema sp.]|jgi:tetratricopeptide (TPR) repeat protein|nr:tetratricopeptide repeat protein [Treponema sp.]
MRGIKLYLLPLLCLGLSGCDTAGDLLLSWRIAGTNLLENLQNSKGGKAAGDSAYYLAGEGTLRESLESLFIILDEETGQSPEQFAVVQEIANNYIRSGEYLRLIRFLGDWTNRHPDDPYTAYYLLMIGYAYTRQDAWPAAALYFDMIIKNYPDLSVGGKSIHLTVLQQLITLERSPEQRVWYYEELLSRFSDKINPGVTWFSLAQTYEENGDWNGAIQAYTQFLPYYGTVVPGFPDAYTYAKQMVDFNRSAKDWTFETLAALVNAVEAALDTGNSWQLQRYQAKVNFFARTWEQEDEDNSGMAEFNLSDFMRENRIRYATELDAGSNASDAYLRTSGWSQYISVWYLYFRKIYFPLDPEIHGRWEWAGVYYGEKF